MVSSDSVIFSPSFVLFVTAIMFTRDGCRPYVEVYQGEERVMTTQQEYERMTLFNITHGKVTIDTILPHNICHEGIKN